MQYSHPHIRQIARRIPLLCALYFSVFSFCYLYFFQCDLLAQTQFRLSEGTTVYHPLLAAVVCTLLLLLLGVFVARLCAWLPLRMKSLAWFLPFMLLGGLTHWRYPLLGDAGTSPRWATIVLLLLAYGLLLLVARLYVDSSKERETFSTYAWPNTLLLGVFTMMAVGLSNTDIVLHHTLQAARLLKSGEHDRMLQAVRWERHPSRPLSAMTAYALSQTGQLGERLFQYPQPYGSAGLIPQMSDSVLFYNLPLAVGNHLGYKKSDRTPATLFLEAIADRANVKPSARDYRLCAYLLDRNLQDFTRLLLQEDTLSTLLPLHYREALVLRQSLYPEVGEVLEDSVLNAQYLDFDSLRHETGTKTEREFRCRERFGATYWTYFFFD